MEIKNYTNKQFNKVKSTRLFILGLMMVTGIVHAQFNKLIDYSGLFRMNGTYNRLGGEALDNDSLSERRSSNAYALFDFGINVSPYKELKVSTIIRSRSVIGASFSQQVGANIMQFRQIRIEGNLGKVIKYQLGDIDVSMTKYTLYNSNESYHDYESDAFAMRRNIVAYENFNIGNNWRMQGGQFESNLLFRKYLDRVKAKALLTRVKKSNLTNIPDRYVLGGSVTVVQSKYVQLGANYISVFDNVGTAVDTAYDYSNRLLTGEYKFTYEMDKLLFNLYGEMGPSYFKYFLKSQRKTEKFNDYFYDLGLSATYKPAKLKLYGGYRNVGPLFSSPTAQTLRLYPYSTPTEVSKIQNASTTRQASIYDRMTQEGLYNQSIYVGLMQYLPIYGNASPYGQATPNRTGLTVGLSHSDSASALTVDAKVEMLSEVMGEGTNAHREFKVYQGGLKLDLAKLASLKKRLGITFGMSNEQTTRSGPAPIDFKTNLLDAGLNYEFINRLEVLLGAKYLQGKGNELLAQRDLFNNITAFNDYIIDSKQTILTAGLRYRFFKDSYVSVQYNSINNKDVISSNNNYQWSQIWGNLTIKF